jgi:hypothetical protein
MDSSNLIDFAGWRKWCRAAAEEAPQKPGAYIFRLAAGESFGRLKGKSDLVYIGSTTKRTIRDRLRDHLSAKKIERNVGYRLARVRKEVGPLEVSWRAFDTHGGAKHEERALLGSYERDHIEFPPLNRQEPGKGFRQVLELSEQLSPGELQRLIEIIQKPAGPLREEESSGR